jgi:hypothetical protein
MASVSACAISCQAMRFALFVLYGDHGVLRYLNQARWRAGGDRRRDRLLRADWPGYIVNPPLA